MAWTDILANVAGDALFGAATGGLMAELTGGDWKKGAATGAIGGAAGSAIGGAFGNNGAGYGSNMSWDNSMTGSLMNSAGNWFSGGSQTQNNAGGGILTQDGKYVQSLDQNQMNAIQSGAPLGDGLEVSRGSTYNPVGSSWFDGGYGNNSGVGSGSSNSSSFGGKDWSNLITGGFNTYNQYRTREDQKSATQTNQMIDLMNYGQEVEQYNKQMAEDTRRYNEEMAMQKKIADQQYAMNQTNFRRQQEAIDEELRRNAQQEASWSGSAMTYRDKDGNLITVDPTRAGATNAFESSALSKMYA